MWSKVSDLLGLPQSYPEKLIHMSMKSQRDARVHHCLVYYPSGKLVAPILMCGHNHVILYLP